MQYKGSLVVLDYESLRNRSHLYWVPKQIQAQEADLPPTDRIEFPLARAAQQALLDMSDPEKEIAKSIYDRSVTEGVLLYDIGIEWYWCISARRQASTSTTCVHHLDKVVETWFY